MAELSQVKWGAVCVTKCVLKQRSKRETCECTPSRVCTYCVTSNPTHPSYSRRHSDVPGRATLFCVWRVHVIWHGNVHTCVYSDEDGRETYRHVRSCSRISRIVPGDGRVTSAATLTWPPGWRVSLTLSEICAARYLSSWRFRSGCRAKRHLFPFFTPHKKIS